MLTIISNTAQCRRCGSIITSRERNETVSCSCGAIAVHGGRAMLGRSGASEDLIELAEIAYVESDPDTAPERGRNTER